MQTFSTVKTSGYRFSSCVLVAVLAAGLAALPSYSQASPGSPQDSVNDEPAPTSVHFSVAGLYINPIESDTTAPLKDPIPCVPCDGVRNLGAIMVDVSGLLPFPKDWQLEGIYLTVGDYVYWFDRSTDPGILSDYSEAAFATVVIEDFYGVISDEKNLGLFFEFLHEDRTKWIKNQIVFP